MNGKVPVFVATARWHRVLLPLRFVLAYFSNVRSRANSGRPVEARCDKGQCNSISCNARPLHGTMEAAFCKHALSIQVSFNAGSTWERMSPLRTATPAFRNSDD